MSATDILRVMLDERGVEWTVPDEVWDQDSITYWQVGIIKWVAFESESGTLWLTCNSVKDLTPEQAIAATLGRGTCKVDVLNTGDCAGYECSEYIMHCNGCGHEFGHVLYNEDGDVWMSEPPRFCPECGRKVVVE